MITDIKINKPTPLAVDRSIEWFTHESNIQQTIRVLESGKSILISGLYSNGLLLLQEIQAHLAKKFSGKSYRDQRDARTEYRKLSNRILIEISGRKLAVSKSPSIGWLDKLYPEISDFFLTFPQIQGLNSSWQWFVNGVSIPVLRNKLNPYYGVYFPTRFEHLELFDNWLKRYTGTKKTAIDVGVGCGVLSLQMVQHGFQKVFGTDTNPNAIVGFADFMGDTKLSRKIELDHGNLFGKWEKQTELIVFNPPWLPESHELDRIDEAIYYPDNLFEDFFEEAKKRLLPDGKLVIMFSNLGQITNLEKENPIEKELANGGRFQLERLFKKTVKAASEKTTRNQFWRDNEEVELWVLTNK